MQKRGIGHIEVILAFILFVSFLAFGLYFFNPLDSGRVLDSTLFYATDAISKNVSSDLLIYGIVINSNVNTVSLDVSRNEISNEGVRVENNRGIKKPSSYENGNLVFEKNAESFFFVLFGDFPYNGEVLNEQPTMLESENFSISSSDTKSIFSESKLLELKQNYDANYNTLKTKFNLPGRTDFSFRIDFALSGNDSIIATTSIPDGIDVYSKSNRVEVLRTDGSRVFADFTVGVW